MSNKVDASTRGVPEAYFSQAQDLCRDFELFDANKDNLLTQEELEQASGNEALTEAQRATATTFGDDAHVAPLDQFQHKQDKGDKVIGRDDVQEFTGGQVGKDARGDQVDVLKLWVGTALLYQRRGIADTADVDASGNTPHGPDGRVSVGDLDTVIDRAKDPDEKALLQYVRKHFSLLTQLQNPNDARDPMLEFGDMRAMLGIRKDPDAEF